MPLVDLTQTFTAAMPVYPGDNPPRLEVCFTIEKDGATNYLLETSMHVGTHIDGPLHMVANAPPLSVTMLDNLVGKAVVVDARGLREIGPDIFRARTIKPASIVLVCTGWSHFFKQEKYYHDYPVLTPAAANYLVEQGVTLVGLDTPSPDQPPFNVHKILLGKNICIIENLTNLEALVPAGRCEVIALPLKVEADSAPARVIARL